DWNIEKNQKLIKERNISFEEIVVLMEQGNLLDVIDNATAKYQHQKMFVVDVKGYVYLVPFVQTGETYFLKTIFPSRKATKEYLKEGGSNEA
ncbi:MAG: BrnT family toxin, partial [Candidatus Omnitrophica bacterium]|nr:BrnT family toxin [Candidatus Omnitrophota bacterium]